MAYPPLSHRYEFFQRLGAGARGEVFLVLDRVSRRRYALKYLTTPLRLRRQEIEREFRSLAKLRHPTIVSVFECGLSGDGHSYFTMEYVSGQPIDAVVRAGDCDCIVQVGCEIAHGLEVLHAAGILHGDLKPSNVLGERSPGSAELVQVRLVDFGLSASLGDPSTAYRGSPGYVAPEVIGGKPLDVPADLYALGATLYSVACGVPPFRGEDQSDLLRQQLDASPDGGALAQVGMPAALVELILRLMAVDPSRRPRSAAEVRRELERIAPNGRPTIQRRLDAATVVGREAKLAAVEQALHRPASTAQAIYVLGSSGSGKSAFLSEAGRRAALHGDPVVTLATEDVGRLFSFGPSAPSALHERFAPLGVERNRTLILLDDAQSLSVDVQEGLRKYLLSSDAPPSLWLIAQDDPERLALSSDDELCELKPLDRDSIADLVGGRLRETPPSELVDVLVEQGRGHPGATVRILRSLAAEGVVREDAAGLLIDRERLLQFRHQSGGVLDQGVDGLSPDARVMFGIVLLVGAIGREHLEATVPNADSLIAELERGGLLDCSEQRVCPANAAAAERLLRGESSDRLRPIVEQLLELPAIPPLGRFRLCVYVGRTKEALALSEQIGAKDPDPTTALTVAAGLALEHPHVAAIWYERAARKLFSAGRYEAATQEIERSLSLGGDSPERSERLLLLSTAHLRTGQIQATAAVLSELLARPLADAIRAQALTNKCTYLRGLGQFEEAEEIGRQALSSAEAANDDAALAQAAQMLSLVLLSRGNLAEARTAAVQSVEAHRRIDSLVGELRALGICAAIAHAQGRSEEAIDLYRSAMDRARGGDLRLALEELAINYGALLGDLGRWSEARRLYAEATHLGVADHRPRHAATAHANLALAEAILGNVRVAKRHARTAIRLARRHLPASESFAWRVLSQAERYHGRFANAQRSALCALDCVKRRGSAIERGWCLLEYGAVLEARHRHDQALHAWLEALQDVPDGQDSLRTMLLAHAAVAAAQTGENDRARLLSAEISSMPRPRSPLQAAMVAEAEVVLSLVDGAGPRELPAAEHVIQLYATALAPAERARCILTFSTLLHRHGQFPAPCRTWLHWASDEFERLGDHGSRERSLNLLVRWLEESDRASDQGRDEELLEAVSELLTSLPDLKALSKKAMELVVRQLQAERGVFLVVEPATGKLFPTAEYGRVDVAARRHAIGYSRRVVRRVAKSGHSMLVGDATHDVRANSESVMKLKLRSILCVPLYAAGNVVGAVYLDDSRRPGSFSPADQHLLERIANLLAVAIDRSYAHESITRTNEALIGENIHLRELAVHGAGIPKMLGTSLAVRRIAPIIVRASETVVPVLLQGENGTGKELIARMIHGNGARRLKPFVTVNCAAIMDTLLESELFGILPNVATGVRARLGAFREAEGGTLFLDEIGDMPPHQQVALLTVLSSKELTPVGGGRPSKINVRIIAASNCDLPRMVESGRFREDLYFRLAVLSIKVPALRERRTDIPELARHFAEHAARTHQRPIPELTSEFLARLMRCEWSGNVRQLQNTIERVMALYPQAILRPHMLDDDPDFTPRSSGHAPGSLQQQLEELERCRIREALERHAGNQSAAARALGIREQTLRYRMEKHDLGGVRKRSRKLRSLRRTS